MVRDVGVVEELAQDALVVALIDWPRIGVPSNPGAWLMTAAKRRGIDAIRRRKMHEGKHGEIARELNGAFEDAEAVEAAVDDDLGDGEDTVANPRTLMPALSTPAMPSTQLVRRPA